MNVEPSIKKVSEKNLGLQNP